LALFHIAAQHGVDAPVIAGTFGLEEANQILVEANGDRLFSCRHDHFGRAPVYRLDVGPIGIVRDRRIDGGGTATLSTFFEVIVAPSMQEMAVFLPADPKLRICARERCAARQNSGRRANFMSGSAIVRRTVRAGGQGAA
jgi:hypothetical protein